MTKGFNVGDRVRAYGSHGWFEEFSPPMVIGKQYKNGNVITSDGRQWRQTGERAVSDGWGPTEICHITPEIEAKVATIEKIKKGRLFAYRLGRALDGRDLARVAAICDAIQQELRDMVEGGE